MSIQIGLIIHLLGYILPRDKSFEQLNSCNSILYCKFNSPQGRLLLQILVNAVGIRSMFGNLVLSKEMRVANVHVLESSRSNEPVLCLFWNNLRYFITNNLHQKQLLLQEWSLPNRDSNVYYLQVVHDLGQKQKVKTKKC